jgi:transcriptional regulator with XRE-family HTH domain
MTAKTKRRTAGTPPRLTARQRAKATRAMARRISEARRESGLTQVAVARAVRLSPSLVSKIERGERRVDPLELGRFARLFGKSIVDFIS